MKRVVWSVVVTVLFLGVLFVFVFPTRTYLSQRATIARAEEQLDVLQHENDMLEERIGDLNTDAEIERIAREQYNLVRPGEEAYAILPSAPAVRVAEPHVEGRARAVKLPWWQRWWKTIVSVF